MRFSFIIKSLALFLLCSLQLPALIVAQDQSPERTRPRRVGAAQKPDERERESQEEAARLSEEPTVRIGLATDARSVTISTDGRLLATTEASSPPVPLEVARVRIEPRALAPPPSPSPSPDRNHTAGLKPQGNVRLAARAVAPARSAVVYASNARLIEARAPLVFASDDEALNPVRYNEKPYRGRLEVFVNMKGALSVVNVVGLEDYLRGVVPNELSPGGFPAVEALKAQAVAARTYAVANRGQFASEGFDLLPTTRSQVYGGRSTEHPLTDAAVAETRGRVATHGRRPINALYTSTCGGHTEDAENIFGGEPAAYLRGRACAADFKDAFSSSTIRTSRDIPSVRAADHATSARDAALLSVHGVKLPSNLKDEWLASPPTVDELRSLMTGVVALTRQALPPVTSETARPGNFATALALALDGESRGGVLLSKIDLSYALSFRDADDVPDANRADVAQLLREGALPLFPDATLRPRLPLSRARALRAVAAVLESRGLLRLQKATARSAADGIIVVRANAKAADASIKVSSGAHLFRAFGEQLFAVREVALVGGEAIVYHLDSLGEIDHLEVRPAPNGAAADRFSQYSHWAATMTPADASARLARYAGSIGTLVDIRVRRRGVSNRVLDLEVVGTRATAHVTGGRIRTALGLREQLFVVDRRYDEAGRVAAYTFTGRGWGHGVGMCQVGAYGLARAGLSYDKILKAYYSGISVTKMY